MPLSPRPRLPRHPVLFVASGLMVLSAFLPWFTRGGQNFSNYDPLSRVPVQTVSYTTNPSLRAGVDETIGLFGLVLGIACIALVICRTKWSLLPAIASATLATVILSEHGWPARVIGVHFGVWAFGISAVVFGVFGIWFWEERSPQHATQSSAPTAGAGREAGGRDLPDRKCPTCGSLLRRIQVEQMIGNPQYSEWAREGYCSLKCFEARPASTEPPNKASDATSEPAPGAGSSAHQG